MPPSPHRHLRFGWWSLFVFAVVGLVLESLHGFKVQAYLNVSNETRRLMWTLAHAHGTGLSIVNVLFGIYLSAVPGAAARTHSLASPALIWAKLLLPGGFFAGGIVFYSGDPGIGIVLLPIGAALLLIALYYVAQAAGAPLPAPPAPQRRGRSETI